MLRRLFSVPSKGTFARSLGIRMFSQAVGETSQVAEAVTTQAGLDALLKEASASLKTKADSGDASAQASYGEFLESETTKSHDLAGAAEYYRQAAEQRDPSGLYNYGRVLLEGIGIEKNEQEGLHYLNVASSLAFAPAQLSLGYLYLDGAETIKQNPSLGARYLKLAADQGLAEAQRSYGFLLLNGNGVAQNETEATRYFNLAAEQDNGKNNKMSAREARMAANYLTKGADSGSLEATEMLAKCYYEGRGVDKDENKALELAQKIADSGSSNGDYLRGFFYQSGIGGIPEWDKAVEAYEAAVAKGNASAMTNLGLMCSYGHGVQHDMERATGLFKSGAEAGSVESSFYYAALMSQKTSSEDLDAAVKHYKIAVEAGHPIAMQNLAIMYVKGHGVAQDSNEALKLFEMSGEKGNADGYANMAFVYENGVGVPKDQTAADKYFKMAADRGSYVALKKLQLVK